MSRYHAELRVELPELIALADRVEREHRDDALCPTGLRAHLEEMHQRVLDHLAKEERVVFPMILEGHGARTGGPVRVMELEHDEHLTNLARVRQMTHNFTASARASAEWNALYVRLGHLEAELLEHIALENTVLFPRALNDD